ncbi:hypothetical protein JCM6882_004001 [Rhodosporidiobolus microsporus]
MVSASIKGTVLASSESCEVVEGNQYFPPSALNKEFFKPAVSQLTTHCPWKGDASYYDIHVDGEVIPDAAWYYPSAKDAAKNIEGYVAFYKNKVDVKA